MSENKFGSEGGVASPENFLYEETWEVPSDVRVVDEWQEKFASMLTDVGWEEDEMLSMCLGFREALINGIVHGNLGIQEKESIDRHAATAVAQSDAPVNVDVKIGQDAVIVTIRDQGEGFDWRAKYDPTAGESLMASTGRGRLLMSAYFETVYNEKGNEVTLTKRRKPPAS